MLIAIEMRMSSSVDVDWQQTMGLASMAIRDDDCDVEKQPRRRKLVYAHHNYYSKGIQRKNSNVEQSWVCLVMN